MSEPSVLPPLDERLARALLLHAEAESAFGVAELPRRSETLALALSAALDSGVAPPATLPVLEAPAAPGASGPPLEADSLASIAAEIAVCEKCELCRGRTKTVPGQGNPRPRLLFVGEAPGAVEDAQGLAFVGPAGELLTRMIQAMGLGRDDVFIANVLKCRPPQNDPPEPHQARACFPYLERQIAVLEPEIICALGAHAAVNLLGRDESIGRLRGRVFTYGRSQLVATYHPSYLLRTPEKKKDAWQDLQLVMKLLGLPPRPPG